MEFNYIKDKILETWRSYFKKFSINKWEDYEIIKLQEELWELAQAYLIYNWHSRPEKTIWKSEAELKENVAKEIADVIWVSFLLADKLWIDLEKSLIDKWFDKNK